MNKSFFECKKYVTNTIFIKKALSLKLNLSEFLMLTYFDNDLNAFLNMEVLSENLGFNIEESYQVFNSLLSKKLITVKTNKDIDGRMIEKVSLDPFYEMIMNMEQEKKKDEIKQDVYSVFEQAFGRTISSIEYEYINAWLEKGFSEELVVGAIKEAVYNGVSNLRYIDKILFEWGKKGFKTMNDVNNHLQNKEEKKPKKELFDYDWVNSNDED